MTHPDLSRRTLLGGLGGLGAGAAVTAGVGSLTGADAVEAVGRQGALPTKVDVVV
ncbi:MAG: hypothetical protein JWN84_559, partial [Nocardioides sp.]|nr:hypothetical protein [Nocardioides sp.]